MNKAEVKTSNRKPQFVVLTVVSMSEHMFALQDYNFPFEAKELKIIFLNGEISLANSLVSYNIYGRLTNPFINQWIQEHNLHLAKEPVKLVFEKQRNGGSYHYILYTTQGNYLFNYLNGRLQN